MPTSLPWGVAFPEGLPPTTERVHPTQLYEAAALAALTVGLLHKFAEMAARLIPHWEIVDYAHEKGAMPVIEFTDNYEDVSTDQGFQFKFRCERCGDGFMSSFQTNTIGVAGSLLRGAGNMLGGIFGQAGLALAEQRGTGCTGNGTGNGTRLQDHAG